MIRTVADINKIVIASERLNRHFQLSLLEMAIASVAISNLFVHETEDWRLPRPAKGAGLAMTLSFLIERM